MAQLRNFQFLRNGENTITSFASYALARTAAITAFGGIGTLQDGELVLYSYKLDGDATTVHTLLGIKRNGGIEIVANYDELTNYVDTQIQALDSTVTSAVTDDSNGVSVSVTQVDGKITAVSVVAPSLTSAIEALDVEAFSLTEVSGTELKGYEISEKDGKIVKGQTAETLLTFASAPNATNKVVTEAEIAGLDADVTSTTGQNVQVQVIEEAGVITEVNVVTDNTVNATDVDNAIAEAIAGLETDVEDTNGEGDITVKVSQANGVLTSVEISDTLKAIAHSGEAADVSIADTAGLFSDNVNDVEKALAELMTKANQLDAAQLSAGNGISITDKKINSDFVVTIENREANGNQPAGEYIVIKGKGENGEEITSVNANAFVKDGFLQKVEIIEATAEGQENVLRFTWNSDAGIQVTDIKVSELCDVYTADETYLHLNGFKFEHKTVDGLDSTDAHGITADVTVNSTDEKTFKVPTLKVDAAGHVVSVDEKTVTITLPETIDTAVQTVTAAETEVLGNAKFVAVKANRTDNDVVLTTEYRTQAVATASAEADGLATANDVQTYVNGKIDVLKDYNTETTVSAATDGGIIVTPTITGADTVNEQRTYAISLATVSRVDNATAEGAAGQPSTSSFADDAKTFTYVKAVHTDANGRVTGIDTETVTENFDAGTY